MNVVAPTHRNSINALLLIALLYTLAARLRITDWVESLMLVEALTLLGAILGVALGFSRLSILFCFLFEAVLLALGGGVIGAGFATLMGTVELSMINFASWSELVFRFRATPEILVTSVVSAVLMGIMGGFLPAIRAARTSPLAAMRG